MIATYNIACCYASLDEKDSAFLWLRKAMDAGMKDLGQVRHDPDLENLRGDPRFDRIEQELEGHEREYEQAKFGKKNDEEEWNEKGSEGKTQKAVF